MLSVVWKIQESFKMMHVNHMCIVCIQEGLAGTRVYVILCIQKQQFWLLNPICDLLTVLICLLLLNKPTSMEK